jgi:light-regulated signal transduction histidine kinase (bacteriophytochrome)
VGRTEEDLEEVNFNKLVEEILTLYRRQTEELNASFNFENLPTFQTFKTPVRQIFQNLIGNSLKYHKANEAPVISITCKETKTHFQFSIEDNGIGIAPEYFDKIFIIFQRLHNKDEYSGTGMGLAIAKKIIENLGGKIWIESREGKGSTFYFTLLKK